MFDGIFLIFFSCIPLSCSVHLKDFSKTRAISASANLSVRSVILDFKRLDDPIPTTTNLTIDDNGTVMLKTKRSLSNDHVSRNITMVLENLLKNYERTQLPTHGKDEPTIVETNILIRSMGPVSELDMEYSMDCYFRQYWRDQRLSFFGPIKSLSLSIKMLERIWRPDTYFYNGKNSYVHTITVPNKLLRISQHGDILYSMRLICGHHMPISYTEYRSLFTDSYSLNNLTGDNVSCKFCVLVRLTIKAKCPMELRNFPMDRQSCPLILGSYAYTSRQLVYQWQNESSVNFVPGMTLSQFDLMSFPYRNFSFKRREGEFSVLQVNFNMQRHTGYFLIQVYVPCILIVVLSWVSFWIHREATSDRVGLGITTVLTLSTISLDSRTDLPKVRYATALDWFLLMSFFYCIATLLEFAGVHYFTKVGSGEIPVDEEEWEDCAESEEELIGTAIGDIVTENSAGQMIGRRRSSLICPIFNDPSLNYTNRRTSLSVNIQALAPPPVRLTMERTTQTDNRVPKWRMLLYCLMGDDDFRRRRTREASNQLDRDHVVGFARHVNSVSLIDQSARIFFPASFCILNVMYWLVYVTYQEDFKWKDPPMNSFSH